MKMLPCQTHHIVCIVPIKGSINLTLVKNLIKFIFGVVIIASVIFLEGRKFDSLIFTLDNGGKGSFGRVDSFGVYFLKWKWWIRSNFLRSCEIHVFGAFVLGVDWWTHIQLVRRGTKGISGRKSIRPQPIHPINKIKEFIWTSTKTSWCIFMHDWEIWKRI